ncbi:MAG: MFS transporter [Actinomycetota bacterium]|nr:MFS transporter [Actinomycetota bacterium]
MDSTNDSLLRNARFLRLWIGQGISFVGDAVSMVALVVLVVQITGSASAVGGALVARLLPTIASPLAGVLADRLVRRVVLVVSDLARAVLILGLIFARDLATIYALVFLMGLARTVFNPTIRAAFPSVVGEGGLTRANALIGGTFSASIMLGPALGGVLVARIGVDAAFLADAVTYLISAVLLSTIALPLPPRQSAEEEGFVRELRSGFGYLLGARVPLAIVLGAFLTILTINATVPAEVFLAKVTFGAGNAGYGLLVSLWGGGMVLGSALMAVLGDRINLVLLYFLSIFVGACALVGTGLAPAFVLALGALTIEGAATGIDNLATDTILQKRVPEAFLGRVFSIRFLSYSAGEALAYPAGGLLVDALGPRSTYLLAGIATAAAGLLVLLAIVLFPTRSWQQADQAPQHPAEE